MVEAGVGIGVIPETAALRHSRTMNLRILPLDEPWVVRERSVLLRDREGLPACARALVDLLHAMQDADTPQ